jgi:hypothetical protein
MSGDEVVDSENKQVHFSGLSLGKQINILAGK